MLAHAHDRACIAGGKQPRMTSRHGNALGGGWQRGLGIARERGARLRKNPRVALCPPADHDGSASGLFPHAHCIGAGRDVPVADDRNIHRLANARDDAPVSTTAVELLRITPVHRDGGSARTLHLARERDRGLFPFRPATTELDRDRPARSFVHRAHDRRSKLRILHKRRAVAFASDLAGRTAHVDIEIR